MYHVGVAKLAECDLLYNCTPTIPTNVCTCLLGCYHNIFLHIEVVERYIVVERYMYTVVATV